MSQINISVTPKSLGLTMPGEFEKHQRTYIIFPYREDNWRKDASGSILAQESFLQVAKAISQFEQVVLLVEPDLEEQVQRRIISLEGGDNITTLAVTSDDSWVRKNATCTPHKHTIMIHTRANNAPYT